MHTHIPYVTKVSVIYSRYIYISDRFLFQNTPLSESVCPSCYAANCSQ